MKDDDPRITEYALGELSGAERESFERELEDSPEAQEAIRDIRETADLLREGYGLESGHGGLTAAQKAAVLAGSAADDGPEEGKVIEVSFWRRARRHVLWAGSAAAAVLCVLFVVRQEESMELDSRRAPESFGDGAEAGERNAAEEAVEMTEVEMTVTVAAPDERDNDSAANEEKRRAAVPSAPALREGVELMKPSSPAPELADEAAAAPTLARKNAAKPEDDAFSPAVGDARLKGAGQSKAGSLSKPAPAAVSAVTAPALAMADAASPAAVEGMIEEEVASGLRAVSAPIDFKADAVLAGSTGSGRAARANEVAAAAAAGTVLAEAEAGAGAKRKGGNRVADATLTRPSPSGPLADEEAGKFGRDKYSPAPGRNRERYEEVIDNPFRDPAVHELPTFSIDVDTASYANVRRMIEDGRRPPRDAVRIEEMINYFDYGYETPAGEHPIAVDVEVASCPWNAANRLVRIGLSGKELAPAQRPPSNLVFLIDVSGSMRAENKLPLLKKSFRRFVNGLTEDDRISIVVYASGSGLVLDGVHGARKERILDAMDELAAGGSTNGAAGIRLAYRLARENIIEGGANRVILATDGDFNVGVTDDEGLTGLVERGAKRGIQLSALGFGEGNLNDSMMEKITNRGDGNYYYIDSVAEAQKVLVREMSGTLYTIAEEVKVQVDFNPGKVEAYRLIGYANRVMDSRDFADDAADGGEMGAGHRVTALFEVTPAPAGREGPVSRYRDIDGEGERRKDALGREWIESDELLTTRLRYREPGAAGGEASRLIEAPLTDAGVSWEEASEDFRFAAAVAAYGMVLRDSPHRGNASLDGILGWLEGLGGESGDRRDFEKLVRKSRNILRAKRP